MKTYVMSDGDIKPTKPTKGMISHVMAWLGGRPSDAKAAAARANGRLGGRPRADRSAQDKRDMQQAVKRAMKGCKR